MRVGIFPLQIDGAVKQAMACFIICFLDETFFCVGLHAILIGTSALWKQQADRHSMYRLTVSLVHLHRTGESHTVLLHPFLGIIFNLIRGNLVTGHNCQALLVEVRAIWRHSALIDDEEPIVINVDDILRGEVLHAANTDRASTDGLVLFVLLKCQLIGAQELLAVLAVLDKDALYGELESTISNFRVRDHFTSVTRFGILLRVTEI